MVSRGLKKRTLPCSDTKHDCSQNFCSKMLLIINSRFLRCFWWFLYRWVILRSWVAKMALNSYGATETNQSERVKNTHGPLVGVYQHWSIPTNLCGKYWVFVVSSLNLACAGAFISQVCGNSCWKIQRGVYEQGTWRILDSVNRSTY